MLILVTWIFATIVVLFGMAQFPAGRRRLESIETELKEAKEKLEKVRDHRFTGMKIIYKFTAINVVRNWEK